MAYWISRILLKDRKLVAENVLLKDVFVFDGPTPTMWDDLPVTLRGRQFTARVIDVRRGLGNVDRIRVQEIESDVPFIVKQIQRFPFYRINHMVLKNGKLDPETEMPSRIYHAPTPEIGDNVLIEYRGKQMKVKVTGVNYATKDSTDKQDYIQVEEA